MSNLYELKENYKKIKDMLYEEEKYVYSSGYFNEYWICSNLNNSNNKRKC